MSEPKPLPPPAVPLPAFACPLCGGDNRCAVAAAGCFDPPGGACWCASVTIDAAVLASIPPAQRDRACLCPACARGGRSPTAGS